MLLIISLIIVALFIYFLKDSLKKYANIFYIGAAVISIAVFLLEFLPGQQADCTTYEDKRRVVNYSGNTRPVS